MSDALTRTTAEHATGTWPCLPGCETTADHTMPRPDRSCAVQVGGTLGGDPSPLSVEARRDLDTGELRVEFAGEYDPTYALTPEDALALAGALTDAALRLLRLEGGDGR